MQERIKCDCGHVNFVGTLLCESCGCPLSEELEKPKNFSAAMRYEGVSRRSQTFSRSWMDKAWSWLSSVRVAIILIAITAVAAGIGSILPRETFIGLPLQEEASALRLNYYEKNYGLIGRLFYKLGFTDVYMQWWFLALLALIGFSLVVCSLDRVVPLYRALHKQKIKKDILFLKLQRFTHHETITDAQAGENRLTELQQKLKSLRYNVRCEEGALLAEKGRWSRWGPYVNHVGLILILFGVALHVLPGWYLDTTVLLPEGKIVPIANTLYAVRNDQYTEEYYEDGKTPKNYRTNLTLYSVNPQTLQPDPQPVVRGSTEVNHPFAYKELELYQKHQEEIIRSLSLHIEDRESKKDLGNISLNFAHLEAGKEYPLQEGFRFKIHKYYPGARILKGPYHEEVQNFSDHSYVSDGSSPGVLGEVLAPGQSPGEGKKLWYILFTDTQSLNKALGSSHYEVSLNDLDTGWISGLTARIDRSLWIIFLGGIICVIGLFLGSYGQHRRIWLRVQDQTIYLGAHTHKFAAGLQQDLKKLISSDG